MQKGPDLGGRVDARLGFLMSHGETYGHFMSGGTIERFQERED